MNEINLTIKGVPQPKQSARFSFVKGKMHSYQKKSVIDRERYISNIARSVLSKGFKLLDCPLSVEVDYIFPPLKSFSKALLERLEKGEVIYKQTKPDITDNLNKGLFDALEGVIYVNDSRIVKANIRKYYGIKPMTLVRIKKI